jgi:hypothetical protein
MDRPAECTDEAGWKQDPDVLDTWFSSGLWPFSTLGWPEKTNALAKFYPGSDLETGYDILFFWVARMMMLGIHFMGKAPFKRVLLHGMVVDETGDKMSKVKGNVIDPLDLVYGAPFSEVVKKALPGAPEAEALAKFKKAYPSVAQMGTGFPAFGADALRFTLATFPPSNKRIALAPKRIEGYRHFVNKIWNASRLALDFIGDFTPASDAPPAATDPYNRWILSRLGSAITAANAGFAEFRIDEAATELYRFFWNDLCDWYLEIAKTILREGSVADPALVGETRATLSYVLEASLRALHPLMPYVTEEIFQRAPRPASRKASIAFGPYPTAGDVTIDPKIERQIATLQAVISAARTIRSEHDIKWAVKVPLAIRVADRDARAFLESRRPAIEFLVNTSALVFEAPGGARTAGTTASVVPTEAGTIEVLVSLKGLVSAEDERGRIERELKKIDKDVAVIDKKLTAKGFVDRAPKEVVEETNAQRKALVEARARQERRRAWSPPRPVRSRSWSASRGWSAPRTSGVGSSARGSRNRARSSRSSSSPRSRSGDGRGRGVEDPWQAPPQEILDKAGDALGLLVQRVVRRPLQDHELRTANGPVHRLRHARRRHRVARSGRDERRDVDVREVGSGGVAVHRPHRLEVAPPVVFAELAEDADERLEVAGEEPGAAHRARDSHATHEAPRDGVQRRTDGLERTRDPVDQRHRVRVRRDSAEDVLVRAVHQDERLHLARELVRVLEGDLHRHAPSAEDEAREPLARADRAHVAHRVQDSAGVARAGRRGAMESAAIPRHDGEHGLEALDHSAPRPERRAEARGDHPRAPGAPVAGDVVADARAVVADDVAVAERVGHARSAGVADTIDAAHRPKTRAASACIGGKNVSPSFRMAAGSIPSSASSSGNDASIVRTSASFVSRWN